jgi:hypothetical protein
MTAFQLFCLASVLTPPIVALVVEGAVTLYQHLTRK